ncbi:hypothetical protein RLOatenuis_2420 [Rickettsiales bacterium]|nr:hypothetical protein RLOatenuis_2420 [Rickettsiales bacterium]
MLRDERRKKREEYLATLTPEQRAELEARKQAGIEKAKQTRRKNKEIEDEKRLEEVPPLVKPRKRDVREKRSRRKKKN